MCFCRYIDSVVLKRVTILRALPSQVFSVYLKCRNAARLYSVVSLFCVLPNIKYTQYIKHRLCSTSLKVVTAHFVLHFWYYFLVLQNLWVSLLRVTKPVYIKYNSVSQPPGRGPVPGPGINYTGPREA